MDVRNRDFYARVEMAGVGDTGRFEGSVSACANQALNWLVQHPLRRDASGNVNITLRISDKPFTNDKEATDERTNEVLRMMGINISDLPSEDELFEELSAEEKERLNHPINQDSRFIRMVQISSRSQLVSHYEEYSLLHDNLSRNFPDYMIHLPKRERPV